MLTLIQGPAGGAKSQVAAELLAAMATSTCWPT